MKFVSTLNVCISTVLFTRILGENEILFSESVDSSSSDYDPFLSGKWVKSTNEKYKDQAIEIRAPKSTGKSSSESASDILSNDKGFVLTEANKHYGFGTVFPEPITVGEKGLAIQYELKLEDTLSCGGAYIKLIRDGSISQLSNETPYTIMFGPDRCGGTNKVHFIIQYQNPLTKEWEEKHFNETVPMKVDKKTHLYSLFINGQDDTFNIYVDKKDVKRGSLLTHLKPSINPPQFVDDPLDSKPADWVDEEKIEDPEAVKPDDWDEDAPKMIEDLEAVQPEGWLVDAPMNIPDPKAIKPDDWDDNEDGEWEAPLVPNPDCEKSGCGEWKRPKIKNPNYKGKWIRPKITNPNYKGPWKARQVENPSYFEDLHPSQNLAPILGLAVEIWTTNPGLVFDNFVLSRSIESAFEYGKSFDIKIEAEKAVEKKESKDKKKKELKDKKAVASDASADLKTQLIAKADVLLAEVKEFIEENPYPTLGSLGALLVVLLYLLFAPRRRTRKSVPVKPASSSSTDDVSMSSIYPGSESEEVISSDANPMSSSSATRTSSNAER